MGRRCWRCSWWKIKNLEDGISFFISTQFRLWTVSTYLFVLVYYLLFFCKRKANKTHAVHEQRGREKLARLELSGKF